MEDKLISLPDLLSSRLLTEKEKSHIMLHLVQKGQELETFQNVGTPSKKVCTCKDCQFFKQVNYCGKWKIWL